MSLFAKSVGLAPVISSTSSFLCWSSHNMLFQLTSKTSHLGMRFYASRPSKRSSLFFPLLGSPEEEFAIHANQVDKVYWMRQTDLEYIKEFKGELTELRCRVADLERKVISGSNPH